MADFFAAVGCLCVVGIWVLFLWPKPERAPEPVPKPAAWPAPPPVAPVIGTVWIQKTSANGIDPWGINKIAAWRVVDVVDGWVKIALVSDGVELESALNLDIWHMVLVPDPRAA